ncbi:alpha/beta fold hydrolase [Roseococcus sp. DSY-14]|uniref:alpha/beta fold hydrolase n=1 Tax=Roseococcus sp. DSY-14 TaxID=3369650 RepID=UPI00387B68D5
MRDAWGAALREDPALPAMLHGTGARFALDDAVVLALAEGGATLEEPGPADAAFHAPPGAWERFLRPLPPRHHHNLFALRMRVPGFRVEGDERAWARHARPLRRALEVARWVRNGGRGAPPARLRPALGTPAPCPAARGRYVTVRAQGRDWVLHGEEAGDGPAILGLHTAGADGRQFHRLMAEPRLARHRLVTMDLPGHGRSPAAAAPGEWALTTDLYAELILGFMDAWGFAAPPVLLGASMSGEICLEMGLRAPERFRGIVACEASAHIAGRRTPWPLDAGVNAMAFTPEWVEGLMAPQSPAECAEEVWWHYSQGGYGTFPGDILFYSGGWDARERIHLLDTSRCPLVMLTGEYDYSCTAEHSEDTARRIPGARFAMMEGLGHFPFAENPARFLDHLLSALQSFPETSTQRR